MRKIEIDLVYKHYKNKINYVVVDFCKIQENNEWVEAVLYREFAGTQWYVRSLKEFKDKFK